MLNQMGLVLVAGMFRIFTYSDDCHRTHSLVAMPNFTVAGGNSDDTISIRSALNDYNNTCLSSSTEVIY